MFGSNCMSVPVVAGLNGMGNNGYGMDGGWWAWILLFALFGWGNGGFGLGGNSGATTQATEAAIQRGFDNQAVVSKLDNITNGISTLGYDQLNQMNGINTNILQTGFGVTNTVNQGFNALTAQIASCCCENRQAIAQVRYDMATDTCAVTTAIDHLGANLSRQISDSFCQLKMEQKDATIAEQQSLIQSLSLAQSQANQNAYLLNALRPAPVPSYNVPNPYAYTGYGYQGGCCNNGCC